MSKKKKTQNKLPLILVIASLLLFAITLVIGLVYSNSRRVELKGYKTDAMCLALTPSCGYCPGEVRGEKCYVSPSEAKTWRDNL